MIRFLLKGLLRDRHRSLFPIIIVSIGVTITVLFYCFMNGYLGEFINTNAKFSTGHVKIMTRAYAENLDQTPNDLALDGINELLDDLHQQFPAINWVKRIRFGGLLDVPDENGETKTQGTAIGLAVNLVDENNYEINRLNIKKALVRGQLPQGSGEILISDEFAVKLGVKPGDMVTLLSSTMYGSMAMHNFTVVGTVQFGIAVMDRGAMIVDIADVQFALDMNDAASEILGYFENDLYNDEKAERMAQQFNKKFDNSEDEFSPIMLRLLEQNELEGLLDYTSRMIGFFALVFILAMSMVLWNLGLIGGLRRYGEVGVRLAIGENKGHVYRSMIYESVLNGILGTLIGTLIGLGFAYILQTKGFDFSSAMKNATIMIPSVIHAHITPLAYFIGFVPGLLSTVLGTMLSGIGIYKRKTAQLFKELEV